MQLGIALPPRRLQSHELQERTVQQITEVGTVIAVASKAGEANLTRKAFTYIAGADKECGLSAGVGATKRPPIRRLS